MAEGYFIPRIPWSEATQTPPEIHAARWNFTESPHAGDTGDEELHKARKAAKGEFKVIDGVEITPEIRVKAAIDAYNIMVKPAFLEEVFESVQSRLQQRLDAGESLTVHVPIQVRDRNVDCDNILTMSSNSLATVFSLKLAEDLSHIAESRGVKLAFVAQKKSIKTSKAGVAMDKCRGKADIIGRMVMQPRYDMSQFAKDDLILIADDHIQAGAVTKCMIDAYERQGCQVVGAAMLSCLPETRHLQPHPEVVQGIGEAVRLCAEAHATPGEDAGALQKAYDRELQSALSTIGLSYDTLTNREALMVMGSLLDGQESGHRQFFERMKALAGVDERIKEREGDSLNELLDEKALTPREIESRINQRIEQMTRPAAEIQ